MVSEVFKIENPPKNTIKEGFDNYLWIETIDTEKDSKKIFFSLNAVQELLNIIEKKENHLTIFGKELDESKTPNSKN